MHEVSGSIPAFSSMDEVALIAQFGERQTEDNVSSHLKAPCSIHGQSTILLLHITTGEIHTPLLSPVTYLYPTINLPTHTGPNFKPHLQTHRNVNTTQTTISYSTHLGILQTHIQHLVTETH